MEPFYYLITTVNQPQIITEWCGVSEVAFRKAQQSGEQGPQGCGQDVRTGSSGQGWPVEPPHVTADKGDEQQPEILHTTLVIALTPINGLFSVVP